MLIRDWAKLYLESGISVIPIAGDGTKRPCVPWKQFQERRMDYNEIPEHFHEGLGIAVIGGAVSGNLEILDFDDTKVYPEFEQRCVEMDMWNVIREMPRVLTPSGGTHLYYRTRETHPNTKLAMDAEGQVRIETRGEGGYAIAPPSPGNVHPAGKQYWFLRYMALSGPPIITCRDHNRLLSIARSFNRFVREEPCRPDYRNESPTEDDSASALSKLLTNGWTVTHAKGKTLFLCRPGKSLGISATWNYVPDALHVFSSNAYPFEAGRTYGARRICQML